MPLTLGFHFHQIDAPPLLPAWFGSPVSFVAPVLVPNTVPPPTSTVAAVAKSSFVGAGAIDVWYAPRPKVATVSVSAASSIMRSVTGAWGMPVVGSRHVEPPFVERNTPTSVPT